MLRAFGPALIGRSFISRTGTMAISERAILDGVLLAVSEINEKGGVLARPLEPVIEDGQSDETVFARKAAKLIEEDKVSALFGTWTSASRRAVKEVVEKHDHLLFYPISYEGMELSPNIIYGGSVPNQQILPALKWSYGFLNKRRWFLAGLDTIYSRAAHAVIRDEAKSLHSQIVGEDLLGVDSADVAQLIRRIEKTKPDLIVNTIKGDTNVAFFRALRRAGMTPETVPTLSFTVSEEELSGVPLDEIRGHYAAGNYFHSIELHRNEEFLQRVQKRFDSQRIVSDPMQTSYVLVHMWAEAVKAAGSEEVGKVRQALKGETNTMRPCGAEDPSTRPRSTRCKSAELASSTRRGASSRFTLPHGPLSPSRSLPRRTVRPGKVLFKISTSNGGKMAQSGAVTH